MGLQDINEEILDNSADILTRQAYFSLLEGISIIGQVIIIIIGLYNAFEFSFSLDNSMEELFLITLSSISIYYTYQCRQQTIQQKRTFQIRSLIVLRIFSAFNASILLIVSIIAAPSTVNDIAKNSFDTEDFFGVLLLLLFFSLGICQLYYTKIIHKHLLELE